MKRSEIEQEPTKSLCPLLPDDMWEIIIRYTCPNHLGEGIPSSGFISDSKQGILMKEWSSISLLVQLNSNMKKLSIRVQSNFLCITHEVIFRIGLTRTALLFPNISSLREKTSPLILPIDLQRFTKLRHLSLADNTKINSDAMKHLTGLEHLIMNDRICHNISSTLVNLTVLDLSQTDHHSMIHLDIAVTFTNLKMLILDNRSGLYNAVPLNKLTSLQWLGLKNAYVFNQFTLPLMTNITALSLADYPLEMPSVNEMTQLRLLDLCNCEYVQDWHITGLKQLKILGLESNDNFQSEDELMRLENLKVVYYDWNEHLNFETYEEGVHPIKHWKYRSFTEMFYDERAKKLISC